MKLSEAETIQDQLTVLSQRCWFKTHVADLDVRENCPPEQIAQADDPALSSLWDTTEQARRTFQLFARPTMKAAAEYEKKQIAPPDEDTRKAWYRLSTQHASDVNSAKADALRERGCAPALDEVQPFDAEQAYTDAQRVWLSREWQEDVPHPLAEIVARWQERTPSIERDTHPRGILPIALGHARIERQESAQLPRVLSHGRLGQWRRKTPLCPALHHPHRRLFQSCPCRCITLLADCEGTAAVALQ